MSITFFDEEALGASTQSEAPRHRIPSSLAPLRGSEPPSPFAARLTGRDDQVVPIVEATQYDVLLGQVGLLEDFPPAQARKDGWLMMVGGERCVVFEHGGNSPTHGLKPPTHGLEVKPMGF